MTVMVQAGARDVLSLEELEAIPAPICAAHARVV
jgi:hypothetical protein